MESSTIEKYNIRDTKKMYSRINDRALEGVEVITFNAFKKDGTAEVSHIKTETLDYICNKYFIFKPLKVYDNELDTWTISVNEINLYGEGRTEKEANENLIDSILEFKNIYLEKIDLFSKLESIEKQMYMRKIIRCGTDREKLKKVLGLK